MPSGMAQVPCYECAFRRWLWAREFHHGLLNLRGYDPINDGASFIHHHIMRDAGTRIVHGFLYLGAKPGVMFPRLALALDELPHECANQLGCRPVSRRSFGGEGVAQIGFQLEGKDGFLEHDAPHCKYFDYTMSVRRLLLSESCLGVQSPSMRR